MNTTHIQAKESKVKTWAGWLISILLYYTWFSVFYDLITTHSIFPYASIAQYMRNFWLNFLPISLTFILNIILVTQYHCHSIYKKVAIDFVVSFALMFLVIGLYYVVYGLFISPNVDIPGVTMNNVLIFLIVEVVFYIRNFKREAKEKEEAERRTLQYRLEALQAQVNPHFLFNSLNILKSLILTDTDQSLAFVDRLSDIYRYLLANRDSRSVSLKDELEFMDSYASVLSMRFAEKFKVEVKGRDNVHQQEMVPYSLQLLLENVVKHNAFSRKSPMVVTVMVGLESVTVCNPIHRKPNATTSHFGLRYLASLCRSENQELRISDDGTTFKVELPYLHHTPQQP